VQAPKLWAGKVFGVVKTLIAIYCKRHRVINTAILQILSRVMGIVTQYVFEDIEREI
jgi:hypothetical protein